MQSGSAPSTRPRPSSTPGSDSTIEYGHIRRSVCAPRSQKPCREAAHNKGAGHDRRGGLVYAGGRHPFSFFKPGEIFVLDPLVFGVAFRHASIALVKVNILTELCGFD